MAITKVDFAEECAKEFGDFFTDPAVKEDYLLWVDEGVSKLGMLLRIPEMRTRISLTPTDRQFEYDLPEDFLDFDYVEKFKFTGANLQEIGIIYLTSTEQILNLGLDYRANFGSGVPQTYYGQLLYYFNFVADNNVQKIGLYKMPGNGFNAHSDNVKLRIFYHRAFLSLSESDTIPFSRGHLNLVKMYVRALSHDHEDNTEESKEHMDQFEKQVSVLQSKVDNPTGSRSRLRINQGERLI